MNGFQSLRKLGVITCLSGGIILASAPTALAQSSTETRIVNGVCTVGSTNQQVAFACAAYQAFNVVRGQWTNIRRLFGSCAGSSNRYTWHSFRRTWVTGSALERRTNQDCLVGLWHDRGQDSRVSHNIDHRAFNQGQGRWMFVRFVDVRPEDRSVRFTMMADKPGRPDHGRSQPFTHGKWVWVNDPTSNDCGFYIGRLSGMSRDRFFQRNPNAKLLLTAW